MELLNRKKIDECSNNGCPWYKWSRSDSAAYCNLYGKMFNEPEPETKPDFCKAKWVFTVMGR